MLGLGAGIPLGGYIKSVSVPTTISAANLALWYKFNTGQTLDGLAAVVRKWDDQSSNNNFAQQTNDSNCAATSNGALDFEASQNDHYDLNQTVTIAQNGGFCLAVVLELETNSAVTMLGKQSGTNDFFQVTDSTSFKFKASGAGGASAVETKFVLPSSTFENSEKMLIVLTRSASSSNKFEFYKNSTKLTPDVDNSLNAAEGDNPNAFSFNILSSTNGTANMFDGKIYDLAFWDEQLTTAEISNVIDYFTTTHGL